MEAWLADPRFKTFVKVEWSILNEFSLSLKLRTLKVKRWNKEVFCDIDTKIQALKSEINGMDQLADLRPLSEVNLARQQDLFPMLQFWRNKKSQLIRQYSKSKNNTEKDCNTKYFHALENLKRKNIVTHRVGSEVIRGKANLSPRSLFPWDH